MADNFQDRLVVPMPSANTVQIAAAMCMVGAYARLMDLEHKRWGKEGFRPLEGGDHRDYLKLRNWWDTMGSDKRERVKALAWKLSQDDIVLMTRAF